MSATVHHIDEACGSFGITGAELPLIVPGIYSVVYQSHATANMFGKPRIIVRFAIAEGQYKGKVLERFYLATRLIGQAGKKGKFSVTKRSSFIRDYVRVTSHMPGRLDRIPMRMLRGRLIKARVGTVSKDRDGDLIPEALEYSKVSKLLSGTLINQSIPK